MKKLNQCPDCSKRLSEGMNRCSCGWFVVSETKPKSNYQCRHLESGIRCKQIGTMSKQVKGNSWFCRNHAFK